ncbi:MAG TPA: patatin-like phospholipase family protein [Micropepsaceae bacterium]|nr:patatin-like phospholipase family protein [Micropepsaceae bacterium]
MSTFSRIAIALTLVGLAACASPIIPTELTRIDQFSGYRYNVLDQKAPKALPNAAVMLSFSGGGTRAAAFADGVLHAFAQTELRNNAGGNVPLASEIDVISSVSGGSVTAGYFGLAGIDGLNTLENDFLYTDVEGALIKRVLGNPTRLFYPRIGVLESYFEDTLFHQQTYQKMIDVSLRGRARRPYIILNAADMASGSQFSFTQDQFDLICADLSSFRIANAVASSAAFPVAFSPVTIKNRAPCRAQTEAASMPATGWGLTVDRLPEPSRITLDRSVTPQGGVNYPAAGNLARFRRGTTDINYLNRDARKNYVQLLDGGIADNLGLTMPFTFLTSATESPSILSWANTGKIDKMLFVVVNARGESANDFGTRERPPGAVDSLLASIGTPIDATSFQFLGRVDDIIDDRVKPKSTVVVGFDLIANPNCRTHFQGLATAWTLPRQDVDDLIALGKAMVLQSPAYKEFVTAAGGTVPLPERSVDQICAPYLNPPRM